MTPTPDNLVRYVTVFSREPITPEQAANLKWAAEEHMPLPLEFYRGLISRAKLYDGARDGTLTIDVVNKHACAHVADVVAYHQSSCRRSQRRAS